MNVVTRFAPSPTGYLHIGGARTALFNYLFAKHHGGKFLLRIEDTDRARSTQQAIDAILDGMKWLGLAWDGEPTYQFARAGRHAEVAHALIQKGGAYRCYTTPEELEKFRAEHPNEKFRSPWRERTDYPDAPYVIRLKAPLDGEITVRDHVQGEVNVSAKELDDMVLLRSDGTPTYMLAVVVDDHDMGITHVIRGDDHFTNAFRQTLLYQAMGWNVPQFAHIPLIHGPDGAKLSKRHGAVGIEWYRDAGYLPEALRNYLLRLGWSHGDDEIISDAQAIEWFSLEGIGKSPSRMDFEKLASVNAHYIKEADDARLAKLIGCDARVQKAMPLLKSRAKTLIELTESAKIFTHPPAELMDDEARTAIEKGKTHTAALKSRFEAAPDWSEATLDGIIKGYIKEIGAKFPEVGIPLRAALTGHAHGPGIAPVMAILGRDEALQRLKSALN